MPLRVIREMVCGRRPLRPSFCDDTDLINYVQEIVGMAAIGKVYQEHMIIAYGSGANGKSTFGTPLQEFLVTIQENSRLKL